VRRFDAFILRRYTSVAHAFQRLTGHTTFFLAKLCAGALALSWLLRVFLYWTPQLVPHDASNLFDVIAGPFMVVLWIWDSIRMRQADEQFNGETLSQYVMWRRDSSWNHVIRLFILCLLPFTVPCFGPRGPIVAEIPYHWHDVMIVSFLYFVSVDPLPPCRGKIREWLSKAFTVLRPVGVPS
jgi:hypothetical protein